MSADAKPETVRLTGGCQCGAVRYAVHEQPQSVGLCHCRMCQKASGSPFFATFTVSKKSLEFTRGRPGVFRSSLHMERAFCRDCGTPLYNNWVPNEVIHPAIATLDDRSTVRPTHQSGIESRLPWTNDVPRLPEDTTASAFKGYEALAEEIRRTSRQHPDHDTAVWPPRGEAGA